MGGSYAPPKGILFVEPQTKPLIPSATPAICAPLAQRFFSVSPGQTPANVYQDPYLVTPYSQPLIADQNGMFAAIFLDPSVLYRQRLLSAQGTLLQDVPVVNTQPLSVASSVLPAVITTASVSLSATGLQTTVTAAGVYGYEFYLEIYQNNVAPLSVQLAPSFSGTLVTGTTNMAAAAGCFNGINATMAVPFNSASSYSIPAATRCGIWIRGAFSASSAGTLSLSWGAGSGGATYTLTANSFLLMQPMGNYGILFTEPQNKPLAASVNAKPQPGCYRTFGYSLTGAPAPVYADAGLQRQLSQIPGQQQPSCTSDLNGRFNPIYIDPSEPISTLLWTQNGTLIEEVNPVLVRAFEPTCAVKPAPTIRPTGAGQISDPALQLTLDPGVYAIEAELNFICNVSGLSAVIGIGVISGNGSIVNSSTTASSVVYENNAPGNEAGSLSLPFNLTLSLNNASTYTTCLLRGSITIVGSVATVGLKWAPTGGAGNIVALNAGSCFNATQIG
jgi:hypothetical protein